MEPPTLKDPWPTEMLARIAYHAYGEHTDFKNFQGNPMPLWEELPDRIRGAWRQAAASVRNTLKESACPPK